ncbi:Phosphatidate cytidylyltransferase [Thalassocella blandensis]|nr:Phosphatidate cytidylyltransferase [Thalassocella blandensis]
MLKQRVVTASVLAIVFLGVLFFSPLPVFAAFISGVYAVGVWEWANLAGLTNRLSKTVFTLSVAFIAFLLLFVSGWLTNYAVLQSIFIAACAWWALSLLWIQSFPASAVIWGGTAVRLLMGVLVIAPAWLASLYLRQLPQGAWLVLVVVLLVATADIGAYFTGKAFGKRKLAPQVSPGKSWEGVWGGAVMVMALALIANVFLGTNWLALLCVVIPTALISVVGDLLESMVKRHRGVKDSSQILPGHGGVLDRIDGLTAAAPVFALASMMSHWHL